MFLISTIVTASILFYRFFTLRKRLNFDTYGHLYFAHQVVQGGKGPFRSFPTLIVGSGLKSHPVLINWLFAKVLGFRRLYKYSFVVNHVLDLFFVLILSLLLYASGMPVDKIALAIALYISVPYCNSFRNSGPRLVSWSPRLLSEIFVSLYFLSPYFITHGMPRILAIGIMFVSAFVVINGSKFGIQALVFIGIFSFLFSFNYLYLAPLLIAGILSSSLTNGEFFLRLREQWKHLSGYYMSIKSGTTRTSQRSSIYGLFSLNEDHSIIWNFYEILFRRINHNGLLSMLLKMPLVWLTIVAFMLNVSSNGQVWSDDPLIPVIVSSFLLFILISIPRLLFLGEAERYPLSVISLYAIFSASRLTINPEFELGIILLLAYSFIFTVADNAELIRKNPIELDGAEINVRNIVKKMNESQDEGAFICYPYHAGPIFRILIETQRKALAALAGDPDIMCKHREKYEVSYGHLNLELLNEMRSEYGVRYALVKNGSVDKIPDNWSASVQGDFFSLYEPVV